MRAPLLLAALLLAAPVRADDAALERQRNEGFVVRTMMSLVAAQSFFREADKDGNDKLDYAADLAALARVKLVPAEFAEKKGARIVGQYWTIGTHDGVFVMEAPNEEVAASVLLHLGAGGNVRTTTLRAYDWAEAQDLICSD